MTLRVGREDCLIFEINDVVAFRYCDAHGTIRYRSGIIKGIEAQKKFYGFLRNRIHCKYHLGLFGLDGWLTKSIVEVDERDIFPYHEVFDL